MSLPNSRGLRPFLSLALVAFVATTALLGASCKQHGPPLHSTPTKSVGPVVPSTAAAQHAPTTQHAPAAQHAVVSAQQTEAVVATLKAMSVRQACNRVMGCKAATLLLGHGPVAIPVLAKVVQDNPRLDKWWLVKAIDVIGQMGDKAAVPMLVSLLKDWRPELRARAAIGLARIADPSAHAALLDAAKQPAELTDPATRGAIDFALDRTAGGKTKASDHQADYLSRWPKGREAMHKTVATVVGMLAEIAAQWPVPAAAPQLRDALEHPSPFGRIEAIRAVARLRDKASIPALIRRLDDKQPSQRRAAMHALGMIVGTASLSSVDGWKRWCEQRRCLTPNPGL